MGKRSFAGSVARFIGDTGSMLAKMSLLSTDATTPALRVEVGDCNPMGPLLVLVCGAAVSSKSKTEDVEAGTVWVIEVDDNVFAEEVGATESIDNRSDESFAGVTFG